MSTLRSSKYETRASPYQRVPDTSNSPPPTLNSLLNLGADGSLEGMRFQSPADELGAGQLLSRAEAVQLKEFVAGRQARRRRMSGSVRGSFFGAAGFSPTPGAQISGKRLRRAKFG